MSKQLLPLFLSVKTLNWRMNDRNSSEHDQEFQRVRKRALERDQNTCRFCGFKSPKWQEVHHMNDDHADNRVENLVTACPYCHMCQHIGLAGHNREAILIYRPEITQAQLHNIVRTAQVIDRHHESIKADETARKGPNLKIAAEYAEMAKAVLAALKASSDGARQLIKTSEPMDLANAMMMMPDEVYAKRQHILAGIRLLPLGVRNQGSENKMAEMVDAWRSPGAPYGSLLPQTWRALLKQFV